MRASVIQAGSVAFDTPASLARLAAFAATAAGEGAQFAVFPEAFIGGYPKGADFGARVGSRSDEGRDWFRRYYDSAIALPGPELDAMCTVAREAALALAVGVIEKDLGTLYCTAVFIDRAGRFCGKHRKLMPTAMERLIWGFGDGSTMPVIDMGLGKTGAAICWENYMPLYRTWLYGQGIALYCAPTVDDRPQWQHTMRHIAYEGRCFVLSACQYATRRDYPADYPAYPGSEPDTALIKGGSVIVSPFGEVLAGPLLEREGVLTADLDLGEIARGKFDLDVTGHYARPDVFSLRVDATAKPAVAVQHDGEPPSADVPPPNGDICVNI
ncbi:MAG: nitrilase [Alphaproteobacteria bacterium]|nr:nitrilase [Alphaproteobacteria bacterium]MDE2074825.1 nitrilase [Alphaproteobacteria bacterium]